MGVCRRWTHVAKGSEHQRYLNPEFGEKVALANWRSPNRPPRNDRTGLVTSRNTPIHVGRQTGVLLRLLAVIALVCSGMVAWAQPLIPHHDSIEWMVHDSSQIGIGTIEFSSHSTDLYAPLRLNVERVLKGAPLESNVFSFSSHRQTLRWQKSCWTIVKLVRPRLANRTMP